MDEEQDIRLFQATAAYFRERGKELREELKEVDAAIRILEREIAQRITPAATQQGQPPAGGTKSQLDAAYEILEEAGKPLHIRKISRRIIARGSLKHPVNDLKRLSSSLFPAMGRDGKKRFIKIEGVPSTFGLTQWKESSGKPNSSAQRRMQELEAPS